jgi:hypothetical protein
MICHVCQQTISHIYCIDCIQHIIGEHDLRMKRIQREKETYSGLVQQQLNSQYWEKRQKQVTLSHLYESKQILLQRIHQMRKELNEMNLRMEKLKQENLERKKRLEYTNALLAQHKEKLSTDTRKQHHALETTLYREYKHLNTMRQLMLKALVRVFDLQPSNAIGNIDLNEPNAPVSFTMANLRLPPDADWSASGKFIRFILFNRSNLH